VVVPAFGEGRRIGETVTALATTLTEASGSRPEIVVVDDGSLDDTSARARAAGADQVIRLPVNRGKGDAVRAGMLAANGSGVIFTDADLSYPPAQNVRLRDALEEGWDVVLGNRHHAETRTTVGSSIVRAATHRGFNLFTRLVLSRRFGDTQCGLKGFHRDAATQVFGRSRIDGFAFDVEALCIAGRLGLQISEVPVELANADESTVQLKSEVLRMLRDLLRIRRWAAQGAYDDPQPGAASRGVDDAGGAQGVAPGPD